jgi:3-hydroxyisobutyrate dehydrogenase-like beta-hydroxyacid dehydrogenase
MPHSLPPPRPRDPPHPTGSTPGARSEAQPPSEHGVRMVVRVLSSAHAWRFPGIAPLVPIRMNEATGTWLIAGHGSVGSWLAARFRAKGAEVLVYDPHPRIAVTHGQHIGRIDQGLGSVDYVASCVTGAAAERVAEQIGPLLADDGLFFDWNTMAPAAKRRVASVVEGDVIDVALLDSIDVDLAHPLLAISGPQSELARDTLCALGFDAREVGLEIGAAALVKQVRSVFMKSLEALVLEHVAFAWLSGQVDLVQASLEHSLGQRCTKFMDSLVVTNRLHARRRVTELTEATEALRQRGAALRIAPAAIGVLEQAALAWTQQDAPGPDSEVADLAGFLRKSL